MTVSPFLSVDEFLQDSQKLPCKVLLDIPDAGYLEGTSEQHLARNTTLELPYWLASILYNYELPDGSDALEIQLPKAYSARIRHALQASAETVNLRNIGGGGGAYYAGGLRLDEIIEDKTLGETLYKAFQQRLTQVMDQSQHTSADSGGEAAAYDFCQVLDVWERELFVIGEGAAKRMKDWSEVKVKKGSR